MLLLLLTHNNTEHWLDEAFLPTEAAVLGEVILLIPIPSSDLDWMATELLLNLGQDAGGAFYTLRNPVVLNGKVPMVASSRYCWALRCRRVLVSSCFPRNEVAMPCRNLLPLLNGVFARQPETSMMQVGTSYKRVLPLGAWIMSGRGLLCCWVLGADILQETAKLNVTMCFFTGICLQWKSHYNASRTSGVTGIFLG